MKDLKTVIKNLLIVLVFLLGVGYLSAWTGPTGIPPTNNKTAPVNVTNIFQVKNGGLSLGTSTPTYPLGKDGETTGALKLNVEGFSLFLGDTWLKGTMTYTDNTQAANKILVSKDEWGTATWKTVEETISASGYSGGSKGPHSADYDKNWYISTSTELTRVLTLRQSPYYKVDPTTVDGFGVSATKPVATTGYHSADTNKDWSISFAEFIRVTVLAGASAGYMPDPTSIDGYIARPVPLPVCAEGDYLKVVSGAWACVDASTVASGCVWKSAYNTDSFASLVATPTGVCRFKAPSVTGDYLWYGAIFKNKVGGWACMAATHESGASGYDFSYKNISGGFYVYGDAGYQLGSDPGVGFDYLTCGGQL